MEARKLTGHGIITLQFSIPSGSVQCKQMAIVVLDIDFIHSGDPTLPCMLDRELRAIDHGSTCERLEASYKRWTLQIYKALHEAQQTVATRAEDLLTPRPLQIQSVDREGERWANTGLSVL